VWRRASLNVWYSCASRAACAAATLTVGKGGVLSEFYAQRRTSIKDGVALVAFIAGWFAAAPYAWPYISRGFDDGGNAARGVFIFLVIVFIAGVVSGALGLVLGGVIGSGWERYHRHRRAPADARRDAIEEISARAGVDAAREQRSTGSVLSPKFAASVEAADYLGLLRLVSTESPDVGRTTAALSQTVNIAAWYDGVLVGVARVITDGYLYAALADIVVHPDYQRRGVGAQLMNRAFDATPKGVLYVNARNGSTPFFERIGCERGTPGFVMRRVAAIREPNHTA
jgi:GNAT superfamily N-acetyltransferase